VHGILNFRDLAEASPALRRGRIFRSARPGLATPADVEALQGHGIQLLIDLRTPWEVESARGEGGALYEAIDAGAFEHRSLPLMTRDGYRGALMKRMSARLTLKAGVAALRGGRDAAMPVMRDFLNESGLLGLNEILLQIGAGNLTRALSALSETPARPALIFCTAGKDRTGLLAAITLAAAGVSEVEIVADYARSNEHREAFGADAYAGQVRKLGLDADTFLGATPETMRGTLDHLQERYGGASRYLEGVGFDATAQARLRAALRDA